MPKGRCFQNCTIARVSALRIPVLLRDNDITAQSCTYLSRAEEICLEIPLSNVTQSFRVTRLS